MKLPSRVLAGLLATLALLVPAAVAHADPLDPLTGVSLNSPSIPAVYPVVDGQMDTVTISGAVVAASQRRVRGSVSVTIGTRILKTWLLSSSGPFSFVWDGKTGTTFVPGTATITVRAVDDDGTRYAATRPLGISAKRVTSVVYTKTVYPNMGTDCFDDLNLAWPDPGYFTHLMAICPTTFPSTGDGSKGSMTLKGTKSTGALYAIGYVDLPAAVQATLADPVVAVTAAYVQKGAGNNAVWVCSDYDCATVGVKVFSTSSTVTAATRLTGYVSAPVSAANWAVRVAHGHDVIVKYWTVKVTYYALR